MTQYYGSVHTPKQKLLESLLQALPFVLVAFLLGWYFLWGSTQKVVFKSKEDREAFYQTIGIDPKLRVIVLVTSWCPACKGVEADLKREQVPFVRLDIEHSVPGRSLYDRAVQLTGKRGIPQLIVDDTWVGHSTGAVLHALESEVR